MADPPRDANGIVIPYDDENIRAEDGLIRHISPYHVVVDENTGRNKLSTGVFSESSSPPGGMSVNLERLMIEDGLDGLAMLPSDEFGAVRLVAGDLRALGHRVGSDPLPQNPYHGEVWDIGRGRSARSRKQQIMEIILWLKKPSGLD